MKSSGGTERARPGPALEAGLVVLLAALTFGLYARTSGHDFVSFDDPVYVLRNPHVLDGITSDGVRWAFTTTYAANWHPVTWLSHMLDVDLFGLSPGGHHLTSALLHALNTVLLLWALTRISGGFWPSLLAAAMFALHPLRVEPVAWVAERKEVLAGTFWMTTLLAWSWYARRGGVLRYSVVALSLAVGLMCKAIGVTLPFVLLLLDVWPLKRAKACGGPRSWGWLALEKVPLLAIVAGSIAVTLAGQESGRAISAMNVLPLGARLANAVLSYSLYLAKLVWPVGLSQFYPHPAHVAPDLLSPTGPALLASAAVLAVLLGLAVLLRRRQPALLMGLLWYLGTLVPMIGIVQVGSQAMADRYTYIPLIGIAIAIAWSARSLAARSGAARTAVSLASVAVLVVWASASWRQIGTWKDSETLYLHALAVSDENYVAHNNYGYLLESRGDLVGAEEHYREAVRIRPTYGPALTNLGCALYRHGEMDEAERLHLSSIAHDPSADAHNNLAVLYIRRNELVKARSHLEAALRLDPEHVQAKQNLARIRSIESGGPGLPPLDPDPGSPEGKYRAAMIQIQEGRPEEAIETLRQAVDMDPSYSEAVLALKTLLREAGRIPEAIRVLESGVEANPEWAVGCFQLGRLQYELENWRASMEWLRKGLELDPDALPLVNQLAWMLATCPEVELRDPDEAVRLSRRAVAGDEENFVYVSTLATAHAEAGAFAEAVRLQREALEAAPAQAKDEMLARLRSFERGRALGD